MRRWAASCLVMVPTIAACAEVAGPSAGQDLARDLGIVTRGHCGLEPLLAAVDPSCQRVVGRVMVDDELDVEPATAAFDGDVCRTWNSGSTAPAWIGLDFEEPRTVTGVVLVVRGSGEANHAIETSDDGSRFTPAAVLTGHLRDADAYAVVLPRPVTARYFRVTTRGAERAVAWREIAPIACGAAAP